MVLDVHQMMSFIKSILYIYEKYIHSSIKYWHYKKHMHAWTLSAVVDKSGPQEFLCAGTPVMQW